VSFLANVTFEWDGDGMVPLRHSKKRCDEHLVVGQHYRLDTRDVPSLATRNHYFAVLDAASETLPEDLAMRFPSREHLRKTALIMTGYRDERTLVLASHAEAIRTMARAEPFDEYAVLSLDRNILTVWTAKSQSESTMGSAVFNRSKHDVLEFAASRCRPRDPNGKRRPRRMIIIPKEQPVRDRLYLNSLREARCLLARER
jgi:hypothetical protein